MSVPGGGGKGRGKEEEPTLSCHAVTYLDLTPLLYPGATQIIGAYPLQPFSEPEVAEKVCNAKVTLNAAQQIISFCMNTVCASTSIMCAMISLASFPGPAVRYNFIITVTMRQ